ncbi:heme utilization protein, partial [Pseudomonas putida]
MKNKLILTLALSVFATGAFAEDGFERTNAHSFAAAQSQAATYAEDGFDRTGAQR